MKPRLLLISLLFCIGSVSCDKAAKLVDQVKQLTGQAKAKTTGKVEKTAANPLAATPPPAEPSKPQSLVDQTSEGVVFRKDIPFPANLEVVMVTRQTFTNALSMSSSELGRHSSKIDGTITSESTFTRTGNQILITLGKKTHVRSNGEHPDQLTTEEIQDGKAGKSILISFTGKSWQPQVGSDFNSRVWADELRGNADKLLIDAGIIPRTLWFGKKRLKIGDTVPLPESHLPVIFDKQGTGSVMLILQAIEELDGHPCGVFSISGNYSVKNHLGVDGSKTDLEMTIQSGKVWLSLLYPLVLKQEFETIQTFQSSNKKSGPSSRTQGGISVSITRRWKETP